MTHLQMSKKRFSDDQIKSLEVVFRADSRPEPKAKQHIACELGLQPRQVAVWFQNRRVRSRTKDVKREFNALKANYDELASRFESLRRENQQVNDKLHELKARLSNDDGESVKAEETTGRFEIADVGLGLSCDVEESIFPLWWEFWS